MILPCCEFHQSEKITQKAHFHEIFTWTEDKAVLIAGTFHRERESIQSVKSYLKDKVENQP